MVTLSHKSARDQQFRDNFKAYLNNAITKLQNSLFFISFYRRPKRR